MPQFLAFLSIALQAYFIYHAYKRNQTTWIFVLLFLSFIGVLIYIFAVMWPELQAKGVADKAGEGIESFFFPEKELNRLREQMDISPSFANKIAYAEGLQKSGKFEEALTIYTGISSGPNGEDPSIWEGFAHAYFQIGEYEKVPPAIQKMRLYRDKQRPDGFNLLLPRALHKMGKLEQAEKEYQELAESFNGEEGRCRYALFLKETGREEEANVIFQDILRHAKASPAYYRRAQQEWIKTAQKEGN